MEFLRRKVVTFNVVSLDEYRTALRVDTQGVSVEVEAGAPDALLGTQTELDAKKHRVT